MIVTAVAMLLSLAGIYSIMAFTVSRRTRDIGVRIALGSSGRSIALAVFRRPLTQMTLGVACGAALAGLLCYAVLRTAVWPSGVVLVMVYAAIMLGVCILACVVPVAKALRIQPVEALRAEA